MTEYYEHGLFLNDNQITKIVKAANNHSSTTIRLSKNNLHGNHKLPLTKTQINRINKTKTGLNLTLSYAQIKHIKNLVSDLQKKGGIIPLLTLIPIIASALGAAGGLAGGISSAVSASNNAKAAAAAQSELERHNREVEKQLKSGEGVVSEYVARCPVLDARGRTAGAEPEVPDRRCRTGGGKVPVIGHYLKHILQKLGLGVSDCNKVLKGGCIKCGEGLYLRPYGQGVFIGPPSTS
jgi:hypothetical protein